jgi:hypothetical protein
LLVPVAVGLKGDITKMMVPKERAAELASAMGTVSSRVGRSTERSIGAVEESIAELDKRVAAASRHPRASAPEVVAEVAQIREHVKNMPDVKRIGWLQGRIDEGDLAVAHAIANADTPWVSGLDRKQHDLIREMVREKFAPRDYRQASALRAIRQTIDKAMEGFGAKYFELLPKVTPDDASEKLNKLVKGAA